MIGNCFPGDEVRQKERFIVLHALLDDSGRDSTLGEEQVDDGLLP